MWNRFLRLAGVDGPTGKSVPFFMEISHGRVLSIFLNNTWCTDFDFGRTKPTEYTFGALVGPLDYYLIYIYGPGPDPKAGGHRLGVAVAPFSISVRPPTGGMEW